MISIIICSRNNTINKTLYDNINNTIGCPFELIITNNSKNKYSIFSAYNEGVKRANYPYLCFMHEDILYHTPGWGKKVIAHFKDQETGIIGIAGGTTYPNCPAPWWNKASLNKPYMNIIQHHFKKQKTSDFAVLDNKISHDLINPHNLNKEKVLTLDGVWLCAHRRVFDKCRFDEITFSGFDNYDLDLCLQASQFFTIYVVFDILIEHFSPGKYTSGWIQSIEVLVDKWSEKLPMVIEDASKQQIARFNTQSLLYYCDFLNSLGLCDKEIRKRINKYFPKITKELGDPNYYYLLIWNMTGKKTLENIKGLVKRFRLHKFSK